MADYIFLLQYFTDDTGVCSHVCALVLWRNSYPPWDCASVLPKMHPVWRPTDTILYSGNPCTRRKMISMATTYISNLHIFGEWVSYMITLSLAGLTTSKNKDDRPNVPTQFTFYQRWYFDCFISLYFRIPVHLHLLQQLAIWVAYHQQ